MKNKTLPGKLTLVIGSNRPNIDFSRIWKSIINDPILEEIILVTQQEANLYKNIEPKVKHIKTKDVGRSRAINIGLSKVKTQYVGLSDDDCILNKKWVAEAVGTLSKTKASMVFGQTFPFQPEKNTQKSCPCTYSKKPNIQSIENSPVKHWERVGYDNNAAARKELFDSIGFYKWWLGPGSLGKNAEDAEFILRTLISHHEIAYNPKMLVYHNRWLNTKEFEKAMNIYTIGELASYGFYAFQGVHECKEVVRDDAIKILRNFFRNVKKIAKGRKSLKDFIYSEFNSVYAYVYGICVAFVFAKLIPIPIKENINVHND